VATRFTALSVSGSSAVLVDLTGLDFIGSIGISTLISVARAVKNRKGALALFGAGSNVSSALERTRVPAMIPTCATIDQARALVATSS